MSKAEQLVKLRTRAGMSMNDFAKALGFAGASSYQRYEKEEPRDNAYPPHLIKRIVENITGRGNPPITKEDIIEHLFKKEDLDAEELELRERNFYEPIASMGAGYNYQPIGNDGKAIPVTGYVQPNLWMPARQGADRVIAKLPIPYLNNRPVSSQYALQINLVETQPTLLRKQYAICSSFYGALDDLPFGALVHLERRRDGEVESTLKSVRWSKDELILISEPELQDFQGVFRIPKDQAQSQAGMKIAGFVIGFFTEV